MRDLFQAFRLGLRALVRTPVVSGLAVLSIGIAIAGNTAVFSMVDAILLRPLPFPDPDRLVFLWEADPSNPLIGFHLTSVDNFLDFREGTGAFEELVAFRAAAPGLTGRGRERPEPVVALTVSSGFFEILEEPAALGRVLQPEDYSSGNERVVVLSHGTWESRFAGDPDLVGGTIELDGEPHLVAGVMDEDFEFLDPRVQLWKPLVLRRGERPRDLKDLTVIGRLRRDVTLEGAREQLDAVASRLAREYPDANRDLAVLLRTMREQLASGGNKELMSLLQGALLFVLLIACANVANLYLARGVGRQKELAVRRALGASRARIVRQLLTEAFVLALLAGTLGTLLSAWGIRLLWASFENQMSAAFAPRLDGRVFLFSLAMAILAGLAFGIAPALSTARANLVSPLHDGGRAGTGGRRRLLAKGLIVGEVALALVMLAGAATLVRTFSAIQTRESGIATDHLLVFQLDLGAERYEVPEARALLIEALQKELEALPGVSAVTAVDHLPQGPLPPSTTFAIPGVTADDEKPRATLAVIDPGYLEVFRIPLFQGRAFLVSDRRDAPPVAIVNEAMARVHFGGENPLGERIVLQGENREIVGVVANVRDDIFAFGAAASQPIVYVPQAQSPSRSIAVALRSEGDPLSLTPLARDAVFRLDPKLSASRFQTMDEFIGQFYVGMKVLNGILSGFGALALLLAAIGIYGVIHFSVSRRTHEIGLRMALGARRLDVVKLIMREGVVLVAFGFAIGAPGIFLVSRSIAAALSGASPFGLSTAAAVGLGLSLVALLACYVPARRAADLHPMVALRAE